MKIDRRLPERYGGERKAKESRQKRSDHRARFAPNDEALESSGVICLFRGRLPFHHGLTQKILDLAVDAAQFVGRPFLQLPPEIGREPKQEWLCVRPRPLRQL